MKAKKRMIQQQHLRSAVLDGGGRRERKDRHCVLKVSFGKNTHKKKSLDDLALGVVISIIAVSEKCNRKKSMDNPPRSKETSFA